MLMPTPDAALLARRREIVAALQAILADDCVVHDPIALRAYECDALTLYRQLPLAVALPRTTAEVSAVLAYCHREGVKIVPRGGGTSLSGGSLPVADAITVGLSKMNKVLEVDYANRSARVQPGVTNLGITNAVQHAGFYFAPDPSSQIACSIGGNIAENSGGVHCLKYGLTTNNVLGVEFVTMDGTVLRFGGQHLDAPGLDLLGIITGSEGLLGLVTEVTVRILRKPSTQRALLLSFPTVESAGTCVGAIIAAGIIPAGMEMMDKPAIHAAEAFVNVGYPLDVEALLIVELDGPSVEVDYLVQRVSEIATTCGAVGNRASTTEAERLGFWAGRKSAFPAVGRIAPDYICMDGTIPRKRLPEVLRAMDGMAKHYGLGLANVFHAGDGNLHPLILFDANKDGDVEKAEAFGADILRLCVDVGGVLTGEHGVGVEKRDLMTHQFADIDITQQLYVKDAFDQTGLLNPGKMFPLLATCAERGKMHVSGGQLPFPDLPRF